MTIKTLTDAATIDWYCGEQGSAMVVLGGSRVMNNPINVDPGRFYALSVIQDGTGSRTLTWGQKYRFAGTTPPVLSTIAGTKDVIYFVGDTGDNMNMIVIAKDLLKTLLAPSGLTASVDGTGTITLDWTDNSDDEDSFSIEVQAMDLTWSEAATTAAGVHHKVITIAAGDYNYRVKAVNNLVKSLPSNEALGTSN